MKEKQEKVTKSTFDDLEIEETKQLKEGSYTGTIESVERDTSTFDYTRYSFKLDNQNMKLNTSFPTKVTFLNDGLPSSQHAKFLNRAGLNFGDSVSLGQFIGALVGRKARFLVQQKTNEQGSFSEIVKDSIKFI